MGTVTEHIIACPPVDAYGFDPKDLIGVKPAKCYLCDDPILRPISRPKKVKALCQACFRKHVKDAEEAGDKVRETTRKERVDLKQSPYRTDQ